MEGQKTLLHFPPYGAVGSSSSRDMISSASSDTCPTCRGSGLIPKGHEDQLVAVIPCNDVRLKPSRTKLYVCISMVTCLLLCCLFLFFLFPRSVSISPVSVVSVLVFFSPSNVHMEVTNLINVSNLNFVPVHVVQFTIQALIEDTIVGTNKFSNMSSIQSRSMKSFVVKSDLDIVDAGLNTYCQSASITSHTLFLLLQMTMNISYLSHTEQLSLNTFEYVDYGANTTVPHPVRRIR
ncbi:transmembrane protein 106A [Gouania willdenowi]|uniref:transmembrane protein 106A n=1 Tax=Gouania willdenowi TaxID=441366 RepID=UPI001055C4C1|nr:transmembrane protein 106B-like [Gouania willdenowi]XP_028332351.1 transmembrane protein 106B-like [Gouania willdenowi]